MKTGIDSRNIVRVESKTGKTLVYFADGSSEQVTNSIDDLEKGFAEYNFIRIHPKHLINQRYYDKVSSVKTSVVVLKDGTILPAEPDMMGLERKTTNSGWKRFLKIFNH